MSTFFRLARVSASVLTLAIAGVFSPALAQDDQVYDTPAGPLRLVETKDFGVAIYVGDVAAVAEDGMRASIAENLGEYFLIFLATGGNACPGYFIWLTTAGGEVRTTEEFGTCSDLYEISYLDEGVVLTVPSMMPGEGDHAYFWDGQTPVSETILQLQPSDMPPGSDPKGWLGRHPAELLDSSDWEALLLNGLSKDELAQVRGAMKLSSGFTEQDGWIAAYGNDPVSDEAAAIALHPTGELLIAVGVVGQAGKLWGVTEHPYPEAIAQVLSGN